MKSRLSRAIDLAFYFSSICCVLSLILTLCSSGVQFVQPISFSGSSQVVPLTLRYFFPHLEGSLAGYGPPTEFALSIMTLFFSIVSSGLAFTRLCLERIKPERFGSSQSM